MKIPVVIKYLLPVIPVINDWWTGTVLSFSPTWKTAWPITYNSMQLKAAEKNYSIHGKGLLAIMHALKKWWSDLLGSPIYVYTDHKTLENFNSQKDLSRCQLRWQEFLTQYKLNLVYISAPDNTVADALLWLPEEPLLQHSQLHETWSASIGLVLLIATDKTILDTIKAGYASDDYCLKIAASQMPGTTCVNGLWYVGDCLLIPWIGNIGEKSVLSGTWLFKAFWHWVNLMLHYMMLTIGQTWGMISKKPTFHLVRNANATNPIQLRPLGLCTHFLFLIVGGP